MNNMIQHKRVAIIGKHQQAIHRESLLQLLHICKSYEFQVLIEYKTAFYNQITSQDGYEFIDEENISIQQRIDFVIVIGGDGTMLGVSRTLSTQNIPLLGINSGRLGFITDINLHDISCYLPAILEGNYTIDERCVLEAQVIQQGNTTYQALAVNDVVINRHIAYGMIELAVSVDNMHMYTQRSDGLIIATSTGSTAYALSVGGPILHPQTGAWVLAPIAPHSLSNRPIILPNSCCIEVRIESDRECMVNFDMQSYTNLQKNDKIIIRKSPYVLHFIHHPHYNYYDVLRKKLHWQE
jgi:NAD+ kinase